MDAEGVGGDGDSDGVNIGESYVMVNIQRAWESREEEEEEERQMKSAFEKKGGEGRRRMTYKSNRR